MPPNWLSDKYLVRYFSHRNSRQIPSKKADVSAQRRWGKLWAMLARAFEVAVHPCVVVVILLQVGYQNHRVSSFVRMSSQNSTITGTIQMK